MYKCCLQKGERKEERALGKDTGNIKFKCGYCFYASTSRGETVRHVRAEHDGKILRIQVGCLHIILCTMCTVLFVY